MDRGADGSQGSRRDRPRPPPLPRRRPGDAPPARPGAKPSPAPSRPSARPAPGPGGTQRVSKVIRKAPSQAQLNDKIRTLLAGHVERAVKQAADKTAKMVDRKLADSAFVEAIVARVVKRLPASTLAAPAAKKASPARVQDELKDMQERIRDEVTAQALDAMRQNAPRMGEAAFPKVKELVREWLAEGGPDSPANASADLSAIEQRLGSLEAALPESPAASPELIVEIEQRLRSLESGLSSGSRDSRDSDSASADERLSALHRRLDDLETARNEFAEQVAEQVASTGDVIHDLNHGIQAIREAFEELTRKVEDLSKRLEEVAEREPPAREGGSGEVAALDLKGLSERVAVLAVGPLMQAIDGRLGELNLEELSELPLRLAALEEKSAEPAALDPQAVALQVLGPVMQAVDGRLDELDLEGLPERVVEKATTRVLKAVEDAENAQDAHASTAAEESDAGYLDDDFAKFREERLKARRAGRRDESRGAVDALVDASDEEQDAQREGPASEGQGEDAESSATEGDDDGGYVTESDAGHVEGYVQEGSSDPAGPWAQHRAEESGEAPEEPAPSPPELPTREDV